MADPKRDEERREALPDHEYRPERGGDAATTGSGAPPEGSEAGGQQPGDQLTADDEPPADV